MDFKHYGQKRNSTDMRMLHFSVHAENAQLRNMRESLTENLPSFANKMSSMLDVLLPIGGNSNAVKNVNCFPQVSLVTTQLAFYTRSMLHSHLRGYGTLRKLQRSIHIAKRFPCQMNP